MKGFMNTRTKLPRLNTDMNITLTAEEGNAKRAKTERHNLCMLTTPIKHSRAQVLFLSPPLVLPQSLIQNFGWHLSEQSHKIPLKKENMDEENEYSLPFNPQKNNLTLLNLYHC